MFFFFTGISTFTCKIPVPNVTVDFKARLLGAIAHGEPGASQSKLGVGDLLLLLWSVFSSLGIEGERRRKTIHIITRRTSRWLWLKRGELWNHNGQLTGHKVGSNGPQLSHLDEGLWCWKMWNIQWQEHCWQYVQSYQRMYVYRKERTDSL